MILILKDQWHFKLFTGFIKWPGVLLVYLSVGKGCLKKQQQQQQLRQLRISQVKVTLRKPNKILCWRTKNKGKIKGNTRWTNFFFPLRIWETLRSKVAGELLHTP